MVSLVFLKTCVHYLAPYVYIFVPTHSQYCKNGDIFVISWFLVLEFSRCASDLSDVIDTFKGLQANVRLKEAYCLQVSEQGLELKLLTELELYITWCCMLQARLLHELGRTRERNACAHQFRHLDHFHPTFHRASVSAL